MCKNRLFIGYSSIHSSRAFARSHATEGALDPVLAELRAELPRREKLGQAAVVHPLLDGVCGVEIKLYIIL